MPENFQIAQQLRAACMRITRRVRLEASGMPPHQFAVLAALDHHPHTASELAAREQVSAPSMSRTIRELTEQGLVQHETSETDRRRKILTLTGEGEQMVQQVRRSRDHWMIERVRELPPEQRDVLAKATEILEGMLRQ
ncbi:MarR family winged helix-turn-helix transcriptional regulator [Aestuariimicrobium ganziense]|uniref:MarR family winged helix-turn-helix transcriptional regulator n=1 Tax=Aestuariimicrobium ganziense TaxID=2773677 RepID=UPI0019416048|nr:MarR family transcriptional regulator [Aestuariimicrobium ganziense]